MRLTKLSLGTGLALASALAGCAEVPSAISNGPSGTQPQQRAQRTIQQGGQLAAPQAGMQQGGWGGAFGQVSQPIQQGGGGGQLAAPQAGMQQGGGWGGGAFGQVSQPIQQGGGGGQLAAPQAGLQQGGGGAFGQISQPIQQQRRRRRRG